MTEVLPARAQGGTQSVLFASAQKELPLKAWGTYNRRHLAPCCMVDQFLGQQFVFPIVVSQERRAIMPVRTLGQDGKSALRLAPVWLQRRAMGLSPVQAIADDRAATGTTAARNRRAQVIAGDAEGLLWAYRATFAPAEINQANVTLKGDNGVGEAPATTTTAWGAGEAIIECFPAFADPDGDGLLVRVTLTNRSETDQTYCIDLLAGMDTPGPAFTPENLILDASPNQNGAAIQHGKSRASFALAPASPPYRSRFYRVSDAFFGPIGAVALQDATGGAVPNGLLGANIRTDSEGQYILNRVDQIQVPSHQTLTLCVSIGVGKDIEVARSSAQTLMIAANAGPAQGGTGPDLYATALKAHRGARFHTSERSDAGITGTALERLMAQSLVNVPNIDGRRIGVGTRQVQAGDTTPLYDPARDALMALGWTAYRPTFAVAQLNAWFQTSNTPDQISGIPIRNPRAAVPTNLMALWEVYQRTHDRAMLKRYYPFARRRYQELLAAGKPPTGARNDLQGNKPEEMPVSGVYVWPKTAHDTIFLPEIVSGQAEGGALFASPDYSAYVIRAAHLMQSIAQITDAPREEQSQYVLEAITAAGALNTVLWDSSARRYAPHPINGKAPAQGTDIPTDRLTDLLPLIAGTDALTSEQRTTLLRSITDPATFWSPSGLRTVAKSSPRYKANEPDSGAVRFGLNWLLWKGLLDLGETDIAYKLAQNLLDAYERAASATGTCPEWLDGDKGAGGGRGDSVGDAGMLTSLWATYRQAGSVSGGWNVTLLDTGYQADKDTLHLAARRLEVNGTIILLCVMGRPNGKYRVTGAITASQTADVNGLLTLILPKDNTTLVIDIAPE